MRLGAEASKRKRIALRFPGTVRDADAAEEEAEGAEEVVDVAVAEDEDMIVN